MIPAVKRTAKEFEHLREDCLEDAVCHRLMSKLNEPSEYSGLLRVSGEIAREITRPGSNVCFPTLVGGNRAGASVFGGWCFSDHDGEGRTFSGVSVIGFGEETYALHTWGGGENVKLFWRVMAQGGYGLLSQAQLEGVRRGMREITPLRDAGYVLTEGGTRLERA